MFLDHFLPAKSDLKTEETFTPTSCSPQPSSFDLSKVFTDQLVDSIICKEKQIKFECKILPYDERKYGEELFKCPLCDLDNIEGRKALTDHLHLHQTHYRPCEGKHLCCLCGKELSSNSSLERHLLTHSNHRPFDCLLCGKKFTTNGNLSRHAKASHPSCCGPQENPLSNESCPPFLPVKGHLLDETLSPRSSHSLTPLSSLITPTSGDFSSAWPQSIHPSTDVFLRIFENSMKAYKSILYPQDQDQVLNLSKKDSPHCSVSESRALILGSGALSSKKMARKISQKYRGRRNMLPPRTATSSSSFSSSGGPLSIMDTPLDLSIHRPTSPSILPLWEHNSFLSQEPPFKMELLTSGTSLVPKHKKNSYKDAPKLIRCPMVGCSQKFPWNSSLMRHILTHTAHKPFRCIRCSKCFSTKSNRERHMYRVHGIRVNRLLIRPGEDQDTLVSLKDDFLDHHQQLFDNDEFLSEREWLEMSTSDRRAEDISHTLLKQAGEPVIEPNPYRQHSQMKMLLKIN